jgi:hypothetical protein
MYGADALPLMSLQSWFSMTMTKTFLMECVARAIAPSAMTVAVIESSEGTLPSPSSL